MGFGGIFGGAFGPAFDRGGVVPWYRAGGAPLPVAAYQPKGAASLAASYVNLANPGTYNAAPGTAPTFDAATGWTYNGSSQYLTTGIVPDAGTWSYIVRVIGAAARRGKQTMSDNVTLPGTGAVVAADEVGGAVYQRVKVAVGAPETAAGGPMRARAKG